MIEQQQVHQAEAPDEETSALGMWAFLASEVMLFGGLFVIYMVYRFVYPEVFAEASRHLNVVLAGINTGVLLCSSFVMALAVHAARTDQRRQTAAFLAITALLGLTFLGIKGVEYWQEYQEQLVPGFNFAYEGAHPQQVRLFFSLYFIMTGLHAIHLTIGIASLGVLAVLTLLRPSISDERASLVDVMGLYWHFVDIVWVFLFPLLYLIDPA